MKRVIKYPKIVQFGDIVHTIRKTVLWMQTEGDQSVSSTLPVVTVVGTEKIHGTNASVCFSNPDGFWVQKRTDICTVENDNAASAFHATANTDAWISIIKQLAVAHNINLDTHIITVYFEWCGGNIQSKSAVSGLDKMSIIFRHFKVSPVEATEEESNVWFETKANDVWVDAKDSHIYNISNFPTYTMQVDLADTTASMDKLMSLVDSIEDNSPVGCALGIENNIAEGIVFSFIMFDVLHVFKVKGEKHTKGGKSTKTRTAAESEKDALLWDIAYKVTPIWRLEQMFNEANDVINDGIPNIKNIGKFMQLLNKDILEEEANTIKDAGLEPKQISKQVGQLAVAFFKSMLLGGN